VETGGFCLRICRLKFGALHTHTHYKLEDFIIFQLVSKLGTLF